MGAMSVEGSDEMISKASVFGQQLGIIFQLKDDIFDYSDSKEIGKPTGNDMIEGKLTLPVIHALNVNPDPAMIELARKVKSLSISQKEIETLVRFTIDNGGIEYSERKMWEIHSSALSFIEKCVEKPDIQDALRSYLDFMIMRSN
jgi:octaprenyl-diphosphate synthase